MAEREARKGSFQFQDHNRPAYNRELFRDSYPLSTRQSKMDIESRKPSMRYYNQTLQVSHEEATTTNLLDAIALQNP